MSDADDYNESELAAGRITARHVTELTRRYQAEQGLPVDGKLGPKTRASVELMRGRVSDVIGPTGEPPAAPRRTASTVPIVRRDLIVSPDGWLVGTGVEVIPMHRSRYYATLAGGGPPRAIVAHYTATAHGTARGMAKRLAQPYPRDDNDRAASWHLSIDGDGTIVQQASLMVGCWHAGGKTSQPIPGLLLKANHCAVGIELVGYGTEFPEPQVAAAERVWRAVVQAYGIAQRYAMVTHQSLDPTRKRDPGPLWMGSYAPRVLAYAYG